MPSFHYATLTVFPQYGHDFIQKIKSTTTTSSEVINVFSQKKFISYNLFSLAYIASEVSKVSSMTFSKFSKPYFLIARWIIAPEPVYPII